MQCCGSALCLDLKYAEPDSRALSDLSSLSQLFRQASRPPSVSANKLSYVDISSISFVQEKASA